jgi:hypothetical protein
MFRLFFAVSPLTCAAILLMGALAHASPDDVDPILPARGDVCVGGTVSRQKLATVLLVNGKNYDAVIATAGNPTAIFSDGNFCHTSPAQRQSCKKDPTTPDCMAAAKCTAALSGALQSADEFFASLNSEIKKKDQALYSESEALATLPRGTGDQTVAYFGSDPKHIYSIGCTAATVSPPPKPFDPTKDKVLSPLRVRGLSDNLNVDRTAAGFKSTTPATASYTSDTLTAHTSTVKIASAFGYAIDTIPQAQIVPYLSVTQSLTESSIKPSAVDQNNNVAAGVLLQRYFDADQVSHIFSIKPQFLYNTANFAEIESVRAIYTPELNIPFSLNTFRRLEFIPGQPWYELLFNVRSDSGAYANRGKTPAVIATNRDFERAGIQAGFAVSTDGIPNFPSMTFIATETYLYGFSGFYRTIDLFQASATYNLVSNYLGLTATYKKGRDEDTAVASQQWTVGLSGRY